MGLDMINARPEWPNGRTCTNLFVLIVIFVCDLLILFNCRLAYAADQGLKYGARITIDERYRFEFVDQANFVKDARASTLRSRIGVESPLIHYFRLAIEFENVAELGDDDFNNTINGKTDRPVVADVESSEVNQALFDICWHT